MKSTLIFVLSFTFVSCGQQTDKKESLSIDSMRRENTISDTANIDTTTRDQMDEVVSPFQLELNRALADPTIDDYYKEIYRQEKLISADDSKMLSISENLFINNPDKDLFFFIVFTKSMNGSDGFYSEAVGLSAFEFVTTKTEWFADYFNIAPRLNDQDMENWARNVYGEIKISRENEESEAIMELEKLLLENTKSAKKEYLVIIEKFITKVKSTMP